MAELKEEVKYRVDMQRFHVQRDDPIEVEIAGIVLRETKDGFACSCTDPPQVLAVATHMIRSIIYAKSVMINIQVLCPSEEQKNDKVRYSCY
jgi:hypothetical protein